MRLVDAAKVVNDFKIEFNSPENEDYDESEAGENEKSKYAILSHTWGWPDENTGRWAHKIDEVTYDARHNFGDPFDESLPPDRRQGYQKIYYACRRALELGYKYIWIDTCCIDKSNSAELTESINSMFRWYSEASVCIVYLADSVDGAQMWQHHPVDFAAAQRLYTPACKPCRWFSRCWTLQELLASRRLEFYDSQWNSIHSLQVGESIGLDEFGKKIASITRVDSDALLCKVPLWEYSVEAKMSWASSRKSGRPEDMAYSLLGIFDIHMPLIYGEGAKAAFYRLQLEIIKSTPDLSIFAWHSENNLTDGQFCSMLASCPSQFRFHRRICRSIPESHYTMTNKGIQMTCIVHRIRKRDKERYFLCLEDEEETNSAVGIFLRKISYDVYERRKESLSEIGNIRSQPSTHRSTIYITTSPRQHDPERIMAGSTHIPPECRVYDMVPEAAWDCESRLLLGSIPCNDGVRALKVGIMHFGVEIILGLVFRISGIIVFDYSEHVRISNKLFTRTHRRSSMNWDELLSKIPEILTFSDHLDMSTGLNLTAEVLPDLNHQFHLLIRVGGTPIAQPEVSASSRHRESSLEWSSSLETADDVFAQTFEHLRIKAKKRVFRSVPRNSITLAIEPPL